VNKKTTAIVVWAFVAFLIFEIAFSSMQRGGSGSDSGGSSPLPKPTATAEWPANFVVPDFAAKTENEIRKWVKASHIRATLRFNYGDAAGMPCQMDGTGIVSTQTPKVRSLQRNVPATVIKLGLYCRY
jgi:hypothetical protein